MSNILKDWLARRKPVDPRHLNAFRSKVIDLDWTGEQGIFSLGVLFQAVDSLAEEEANYYYRQRGLHSKVSRVTRIFAWVWGSTGVVLPLLAATKVAAFENLGQWGYVFLAAGASAIAANSLFGGSGGHVRYVSTQLELEKIIMDARLQWCEFQSSLSSQEKELQDGFSLISQYTERVHHATISETQQWGTDLQAELKRYEKRISVESQGSGKE